MSPVRILHTADWQIGKGFGQIPGDAGALLRDQRFKTVRRLAELAAERQVDAVLVAGDVFDAQTVSDTTLRRLVECLAAFPGPWILLPGNHDAALVESVWSRLERLGCLPANVIPALRAEPITLAEGRLCVLPAPLCRRHEAEDLTAAFDAMESPEGAIRVGLAHGSVANRLPSDSVRHNLIADDRPATARLDYLALGDWHGTLEIADRTWYAGTPETDGFRSRDPSQVLIVSIAAPGDSPEVERVTITHYRWHLLEETVSSAEAIESLDVRLAQLGERPEQQVVRLRVAGSLSLTDRQAFDALVERWQARFCFLEVDAGELRAEASEADLAALAESGSTGRAVQRLLQLRDDPAQPDSAYAADAIQRLFVAYTKEEEGA